MVLIVHAECNSTWDCAVGLAGEERQHCGVWQHAIFNNISITTPPSETWGEECRQKIARKENLRWSVVTDPIGVARGP